MGVSDRNKGPFFFGFCALHSIEVEQYVLAAVDGIWNAWTPRGTQQSRKSRQAFLGNFIVDSESKNNKKSMMFREPEERFAPP
jgi:hypothetical protein